MSGRRAKVVLVDDHPFMREGVSAVLESTGEFEVVGGAASAEAAFPVIERTGPEVAIFDVDLPGIDGIEACHGLLTAHPRLRVVILTRFSNASVLLRALSAGAKGFVVKQSDPEHLRHAVRAVAQGGTYVDPQVTGKLVTFATRGRQARGPYGLTAHEMRVVALLPRGLTNRQIGEELFLSVNTVKTHLRHAMAKMGVSDRTEAATLAQREGLA